MELLLHTWTAERHAQLLVSVTMFANNHAVLSSGINKCMCMQNCRCVCCVAESCLSAAKHGNCTYVLAWAIKHICKE